MRECVSVIVRRVFVLLSCTFAFIPGLAGQVSVLTHRGDNSRTGANLNESILTVSNVNPKTFGKLATRKVDGNIYAQPLVASEVRAINRESPTNLVIVATERNHMYAFDADDVDPKSERALVWTVGPDRLGPSVSSATLSEDIKKGICTDLTPDIGITGTPVIQITKESSPREGVVYVAAKSKDEAGYHYTLFALRLSDGSEIGRKEIKGEVKGTGQGSSNGKVRFDPMLQLNRPGLLLVGNKVYVAFGGHCDLGDYHGWFFAYDVSNPKSMKPAGVFNTTPNGPSPDAKKIPVEGGAGIWMSGEGPSADSAGAIYFTSANGTNNTKTDLGDSVIRVVQQGNSLKVADWFTPENHQMLQEYDYGLGSAGAMLIPDSHLLITGAKDGRIFLLDRDNLGKTTAPLASFQVGYRPSPAIAVYPVHSTPAIWRRGDETFVYTAVTEDAVKQFRLVRDPEGAGWKFDDPVKPFQRSGVTAPFPNAPKGQFGWVPRDAVWTPGGFMTLSANGDTDGTGVLWVTMPFAGNANHKTVRGALHALDASDISKPELWNSEDSGDENDRLGMFAKFVPPTVANGRVFVATFEREVITDDDLITTGTGEILMPEMSAALVIYGLR